MSLDVRTGQYIVASAPEPAEVGAPTWRWTLHASGRSNHPYWHSHAVKSLVLGATVTEVLSNPTSGQWEETQDRSPRGSLETVELILVPQ